MEKIFLTAAAAATLSFVSLGASAADDGAFIGINGGQTHYDISHTGFQDKKDSAFGALVGYRWAVDRPFYIGVEGGYVDLGKISSVYDRTETTISRSLTITSDFHDKYELKGQALLLGANGKWVLPHHWTITARLGLAHSRSKYDHDATVNVDNAYVLHDAASIYVKHVTYVEHASSRTTSTDNGIYAGVGFGYDFTEHFGVSLNYDNYSLKAQNITNDKRTVNVGVWGGSAEFRF
jgi:hypothetical protein